MRSVLRFLSSNRCYFALNYETNIPLSFSNALCKEIFFLLLLTDCFITIIISVTKIQPKLEMVLKNNFFFNISTSSSNSLLEIF